MRQDPSSEANSTFRWSRNAPPFMEAEGSLQYSQKHIVSPYPKADDSSSCKQILFPFHYSLNQSIFEMETHCVFFEVRTEFLKV
jgi:hypothetical protein